MSKGICFFVLIQLSICLIESSCEENLFIRKLKVFVVKKVYNSNTLYIKCNKYVKYNKIHYKPT